MSAMDQYESSLERVQQHIAEAEKQVAQQKSHIAELASRGQDIQKDEDILSIFENTLRFLREDLEMLKARSARR